MLVINRKRNSTRPDISEKGYLRLKIFASPLTPLKKKITTNASP
jgi:hypothetical protein